MKSAPSFETSPEFANFTNAMRKIVAMPKAELDRRVEVAKESSERKGNPLAPGRKMAKRSKR